MKIKFFFFGLFCVLVSSCNQTTQRELVNAQNKIDYPKKVDLDSLISYGNNINDDRIILGNLNNLDIIYGFRGLKFNTNIDTLDFSYGANVEYTYASRGILIVRIENVNTNTFGEGDDLRLTFFKNKLYQIDISNSRISERKSYNQQPQFASQLEDLIDLFGSPTINYPIIKGSFQKISDELDAEEGLSIFNTDVGWDAKKVSMRYKRYWKTETLKAFFENDYLRYEASSLYFTLPEYEKLIQESMKSIDDSLKQVKDLENRNKREEDLKNRF